MFLRVTRHRQSSFITRFRFVSSSISDRFSVCFNVGFLVVLLSLSLSPFFPLDFITNVKLVSWFNPTATPGNNKVKGGQWEVGGWLGG